MEQIQIDYLIKIGDKKHIESLFTEGKVYLKSLDYFRKDELNEERKDEHEGADRIAQVTYLKLRGSDGMEFEFKKDSDKLRLASAQFRSFNSNSQGNLYCVIAISSQVLLIDERLDDRNKQFGDTILLITEPYIFYERLSVEINRKGLKHSIGLVKYYDEKSYEGNLNPFCKSNKYKHQNEFRIFVEYDQDEPLIFNIGSLSDISEIHTIDMLPRLRFKPY